MVQNSSDTHSLFEKMDKEILKKLATLKKTDPKRYREWLLELTSILQKKIELGESLDKIETLVYEAGRKLKPVKKEEIPLEPRKPPEVLDMPKLTLEHISEDIVRLEELIRARAEADTEEIARRILEGMTERRVPTFTINFVYALCPDCFSEWEKAHESWLETGKPDGIELIYIPRNLAVEAALRTMSGYFPADKMWYQTCKTKGHRTYHHPGAFIDMDMFDLIKYQLDSGVSIEAFQAAGVPYTLIAAIQSNKAKELTEYIDMWFFEEYELDEKPKWGGTPKEDDPEYFGIIKTLKPKFE